jgi:hypothetical protein
MTDVPSSGTVKLPGTREIHVLRVEIERTGTRNNKPWTLYRVFAEEMDGTPITDVLKTFDAMNGVVTVESEAYYKDNKIQSYTIKRVREKKPVGTETERINELQSRVEKLERQMRALLTSIDTPLEVAP